MPHLEINLLLLRVHHQTGVPKLCIQHLLGQKITCSGFSAFIALGCHMGEELICILLGRCLNFVFL